MFVLGRLSIPKRHHPGHANESLLQADHSTKIEVGMFELEMGGDDIGDSTTDMATDTDEQVESIKLVP